MPCFHPIDGYRGKIIGPSGKRPIVFNPKDALFPIVQKIPCGQCVGCRLERSRQWAMRCIHEAQLYDHNCFLTLTYDDDNLPEDLSLHLPHFQKFMKRLRKSYGSDIRFFHCGEYGETYGRPHYHAIIFNFDFPDKELWTIRNGNRLYTSERLSQLWPLGFSSIGDVTFESAAYVARYILKKRTGPQSDTHYERVNHETGEIYYLKPEYTTMSRRPGIGKKWYDQFKSDVYDHDFVVVNGKKMKPPRYYDNLYEREYPSDLERLKNQRKINSKKFACNNTPDRLKIRETVQLRRLEKLPRNLK